MWRGDNSPGQKRVQWLGLPRAQSIMCTNGGDGIVVFKACDKFYAWNQIDGHVVEILSSKKLDRIIEIMSTKGERALKLKGI
jgi:hypothetical protein